MYPYFGLVSFATVKVGDRCRMVGRASNEGLAWERGGRSLDIFI